MTNVYNVYTSGVYNLVFSGTDYSKAMYFKYCYDYFFSYDDTCIDISTSDLSCKDRLFVGPCGIDNRYLGG